MIQFGTTLQGDADKLPKEIADWVSERNSAYPDVDFEIDRWDILQTEDHEFTKKYGRSFDSKNFEAHGISTVGFLYGKEYWHVRIKGLVDQNGKILSAEETSRANPFDVRPIPRDLANAIVAFDPKGGFTEIKQDGNARLYVLARKEGEVVPERASEYVEFHPGARYTSEFRITGEELKSLISDPKKEKELMEAKDWQQVREIRKRNQN